MTGLPRSSRRSLRVCLAQINTAVGNFKSNREKILSALRSAKQKRADLIVFPELTLTGYPPEDLLFQERFIAGNAKTLRSVLPFTSGILAVLGFVDRDLKGHLYNSAVFALDKKIVARYHKMYLPNYGVFDEKRYFRAGAHNLILEISGIRLGLTICEDIWVPENFIYTKHYAQNVSVLINISASPYHQGKQRQREALLRRLAKKTGAAVIYQNLVGGQDELVFDGGSMVVGRNGEILAKAKRFEEDIVFLDLPVHACPGSFQKNPALKVLKTTSRFRRPMRLPGLMRKDPPAVTGAREVYQALLLGTRDYVRKNRFQKVLIGLSGGVDSALVARLAVDALEPQNVIGVTMPSDITSEETRRDARRLAENLGIRCIELGIGEILSSYLNTLKEVFAGATENIAEENLQARIRGNLLMALSNKFGHLVLTTGNKSEMATGYCTLYGDMAGGFAVIKDVPKTLVYKLAVYRNGLTPKNSIPPSILKRAPTAELRPNQKDQDTLPPYPVLDRFLRFYVEEDFSIERIIRSGIAKKLARQVAKMVDGNEYKRRQSPPGVKITPKAFGRDRRMPITNQYLS